MMAATSARGETSVATGGLRRTNGTPALRFLLSGCARPSDHFSRGGPLSCGALGGRPRCAFQCGFRQAAVVLAGPARHGVLRRHAASRRLCAHVRPPRRGRRGPCAGGSRAGAAVVRSSATPVADSDPPRRPGGQHRPRLRLLLVDRGRGHHRRRAHHRRGGGPKRRRARRPARRRGSDRRGPAAHAVVERRRVGLGSPAWRHRGGRIAHRNGRSNATACAAGGGLAAGSDRSGSDQRPGHR